MSLHDRRRFVAGMGAAFAAAAGGTLSLAVRAAMGPDDKFDLVIKGGELLDPAQKLRARRDIGIRAGRIEAIEADIPATRASRLLDASGRLVLPGLVDLHSHVYPYGSAIGIPADELIAFQGTTTMVSAGDAGANNFAAFRRYVAAQTRTRLYAFVHIANIGLAGFPEPELFHLGFAHPEEAGRTVAELIEYAKKNPGKLSNGSSGNGTTGHLGGELFKAMTGTEMVHVPYKGSAQAINDLISGNIEVMFDNVPSIGPHVKSGRVRGLGVSAPKRAAQFPELPTIAEAGVPGYETNSWGGVIGPARLSREVISRLHAEIRKALAAPAVAERYRQLDAEPDGGGPEAFLELVRRETPKWAEVIRRSGAKVD